MAAAKKPATKKTTTAKKATTAKKSAAAKKPAAKKSVAVTSLTAAEKKLIELYRGAKATTKTAAVAMLKADQK